MACPSWFVSGTSRFRDETGTWKLVLTCSVHIDAFDATIATPMTMAGHNRSHPAFRISEVIGPDRRALFLRSLTEELHRRFDPVAAERLPSPLAALVTRIEPRPPVAPSSKPSPQEDT